MYEISFTLDETLYVYLEVVHEADLQAAIECIQDDGGTILAIHPF